MATTMGIGGRGHYPHDAEGKPLDTPDWRDPDNIKPKGNRTEPPIITAVRQYTTDSTLIDAALEAGEDVNAIDHEGLTPLMLAIKSKQGVLAEKLLAVPGIELDVQSKRGFTALMMACWKGMKDLVQTLIDKGAKLDLKDTGGRNAWGVAHDFHHEDILELLNSHGLNFESHGGTVTCQPPHPKWRPSEDWS